MDKKNEKDTHRKSYTEIFSYQLNEMNKNSTYDAYLVPLRWFLKLYANRAQEMKMGEIADKLGTDAATFSKMLNHSTAKDKRPITAADINRICEIINVPLSSILFLYEHKEKIEKDLKKDHFVKLTDILRGNFDEILYPSAFYDINSGKVENIELDSDSKTAIVTLKDDKIRKDWNNYLIIAYKYDNIYVFAFE